LLLNGLKPKPGNYSDQRFEAYIVLILNSSLRSSEALALTWNDIDLNSRIITVSKKSVAIGAIEYFTKSKENRQIPMGNYLVNILKKWKID